jgi:hypothetical protein
VHAILNPVIRHARPLGIGVLRGREDRGRGYGPIRHGALSAMDTASVQAISLRVGIVHGAHASWNIGMLAAGSTCVVPSGQRACAAACVALPQPQ